MILRILCLLFLQNHVNLQSNSPYVRYLTNFKNPGQLEDVFEDPINKLYKYGLTRFFFGSSVMPLQNKIYFKDNVNQQFWQIARTWIIKSHDIRQPDTSYNNYFIPEAQKFLCDDWSCCEDVSQCQIPGNDPKNGDILLEVLGDHNFQMPFRFLVLWCQMAWEIYYRDISNNLDPDVIYRNIKKFCPNSCKSSPCATKPGVDNPSDCTLTGLYSDQFECKCSSGMQWDKNSLVCLNANPCDQSFYSACDSEGTDECINHGETGFTCVCNENKMGFDCTQDRNGCLENYYATEKTGNFYCNVRFSNKCIPYLGSNFYKCECTDQFTMDINILHDNCLKLVDNCEMLTCLNGGICTTSPDQTESACLCPTDKSGYPIYKGFFCEHPNGIWSDWSSWSACRPKCGDNLYRLRKRFCMNETLDCDGFSEEIMPCPYDEPCEILKLTGTKKTDIIDYGSLAVVAFLVALQMIGSFFLAQFFILNRQVIFPLLIKYCCAPCHKYLKGKI